MPEPRLDKHSKVFHELFDEDTAQIGSVGDIVTKHAGDAVFLTPDEDSPNGVDGGESDFEDEMNETDPAEDEEMDDDDLYSAENEQGIFATDLTGTVDGIARGFGTHLPQDLGKDGFQVEEIPNRALQYDGRVLQEGEELDDYDDEAKTGKFDADPALTQASQPGANVVQNSSDSEPFPERTPIKSRRPRTADDELDATRNMH